MSNIFTFYRIDKSINEGWDTADPDGYSARTIEIFSPREAAAFQTNPFVLTISTSMTESYHSVEPTGIRRGRYYFTKKNSTTCGIAINFKPILAVIALAGVCLAARTWGSF